MTQSFWQRSHAYSTPAMTADVAILGAGFVGLSTAYWLTELQPGLKIIVIDRKSIGSGASGRNAGFLTKGSAAFHHGLEEKLGVKTAGEIFAYAEESLRLLDQKILQTSPELKAEKVASQTLYRTAPEQIPSGFKRTLMTELPDCLQSTFATAITGENEFKINPASLLQTMATKLKGRGVQILEQLTAFDLTQDAILTETGFVKAKTTILALNGYLPQFHQHFKKMIRPTRAQMLAVRIKADLRAPDLYYDPAERVYWRQGPDQTLLIGGKRLLDPEREVGEFDKVTPIIQEALETYVRDVLKQEPEIVQRWSGVMGFTVDELPIIIETDLRKDTFVVGGFSGHGMGLGFLSAKETAELALGKKTESFFTTIRLDQ
jgi:gamma-glutamylputrescine oxidase